MKMGDVVFTEEAGLLHSSTWCLRMRNLTECALQMCRYHAGGDIGVETAARAATRGLFAVSFERAVSEELVFCLSALMMSNTVPSLPQL